MTVLADFYVKGMVAGERRHIMHTVDEGDPCLLVPEPDNPHDPYAIAVHTIPVAALRDSEWRQDGWRLGPADRRLMMDRLVGYLPRDAAARFDLPEVGVVGVVSHVRWHDMVPAGFDVRADLPRREHTT